MSEIQCHDCAHFGNKESCDVAHCRNYVEGPGNVEALDLLLGGFGINFASIRRRLAEYLHDNGVRRGSPTRAGGDEG